MKKIIHVGDQHLGGAYPEKAAASFEFLTTELWENSNSPAYRPDLIASTGDLTDRPLHVHSEHLRPFLYFVQRCECPIVLLQGTPTHEPLGAIENIASVSDGKILTLTSPHAIIPLGNTFIQGMPALTRPQLAKWVRGIEPTINGFDDPDAAIKAILAYQAGNWPSKAIKLYLYHGVLRGCTTATGQTLAGGVLEVAREDLELANPSVVLCADIHLAQEWHDPCLVSYCGSSHPVNWGELDRKSFSVLEFDGNELVNFQRIPFPHRGMVKLDLIFTGEQTDGQWLFIEDGGRHLRVSDLLAGLLDDKEVKVVYEIPREIAASVDDAYIRVLFAQHGINLAAVERIIKSEKRERIEGIRSITSTEAQYRAWCQAKGQEPRPGALAKASELDGVQS